MSLVIKHSRDLIQPGNLKLKILIFGFPGSGKTSFMGSAPNLGAGICETGHGQGSMSIATKDIDYVDLESYADFDAFCSGTVFKEKDSIGLDSLSEMEKTFIKEKALSMPRARGESQKRSLGVPELDDYGTMAELTRKLLRKLLNLNKHIVVTATLRVDKPDQDSMQTETLVGPDLPGQMFLGSTAMFDIVLCTRTRQVLRDPKDAKSRYTQYYYLTNNPGNGIIAKNRLNLEDNVSFLPPEVIVDYRTGEGTFPWILARAQAAYQKWLDEHKV